jgi:hypothetical protein
MKMKNALKTEVKSGFDAVGREPTIQEIHTAAWISVLIADGRILCEQDLCKYLGFEKFDEIWPAGDRAYRAVADKIDYENFRTIPSHADEAAQEGGKTITSAKELAEKVSLKLEDIEFKVFISKPKLDDLYREYREICDIYQREFSFQFFLEQKLSHTWFDLEKLRSNQS